MTTPDLDEPVAIVHELDLGQHTLFLMNDGTLNLLANDEETPYLADNGVRLDSDETYRLFVSLHEQFQNHLPYVIGENWSNNKQG